MFDLFHIGHLRLLKRAKEKCHKLIVGITTNELVSYKYKKAVMPFEERIEIVSCIKFVDEVIPQVSMDKMVARQKLKFDVMFIGDDWKGTDKWTQYEKEFKKVGVNIIYFPYTKGTSSTLINDVLVKLRNE